MAESSSPAPQTHHAGFARGNERSAHGKPQETLLFIVEDTLEAFPSEKRDPVETDWADLSYVTTAQSEDPDLLGRSETASLLICVPALPDDVADSYEPASSHVERQRRFQAPLFVVATLRVVRDQVVPRAFAGARRLVLALRSVVRRQVTTLRAVRDQVVPRAFAGARRLVLALRSVVRRQVATLRVVRDQVVPRAFTEARRLVLAMRGLARRHIATLRVVREQVVPRAFAEARRLLLAMLGLARRQIATLRVVRDQVVPRVFAEARRGIFAMLGSVRRQVARSAQALPALPPYRRALSSTTLLMLVVAAALSVGLISLRQPSRAPLATTLHTPPWVAFVAPTAASLERPRLESRAELQQPGPAGAMATPRRDLAARDQMRAIQTVLNRYRDGFSILDVTAVQRVWPAVDERSLRKQFDGLWDQNLEFDACRISVADANATALCRGSVGYILSARTRRLRTEARQWQFTLRRTGERWLITAVAAGLPGKISRATF